MSEKSTFRVRLMRWGDSSSSGRTVTLKLPDDTEDHPFKGLSVGARNGQLMEMEITLIEGDAKLETLSAKPARQNPPQPHLPTKGQSTPSSTMRAGPAAAISQTAPTPHAPAIEPAAPPPDGSEGAPVPRGTDQSGTNTTTAPGEANPEGMDAYANQMSNAAESLAAVAEEMSKSTDDDNAGVADGDEDAIPEPTPGEKAVGRAVDLCKAIDQQRAGFFYFMMSRYPTVPNLEPESGDWSRDAKVTRDRVCHHCETEALDGLADNKTARQKFEALENEFERHERLR